MIIIITIRLYNLKFSVIICLTVTEKKVERKTFTSVVLEICGGKQYDITSLSKIDR